MGERAASPPARTILVDTDVLIWYFRGHEGARRFLARIGHLNRAVSSLTVMELVQGCRNQEEVRQVRAFVTHNVPRLLHPNESVSHRAIDLLTQHAMPHGLRLVDALIAATALETGGTLATANAKHYRPISRLAVLRFAP